MMTEKAVHVQFKRGNEGRISKKFFLINGRIGV